MKQQKPKKNTINSIEKELEKQINAYAIKEAPKISKISY